MSSIDIDIDITITDEHGKTHRFVKSSSSDRTRGMQRFYALHVRNESAALLDALATHVAQEFGECSEEEAARVTAKAAQA